MRTSFLASVLSAAFVLVACASPAVEEEETGDEQNVTSAKARAEVVGTWVLDDQAKFVVLVLDDDGTFRRHNGGMMTPKNELKRSEGKYTLSTKGEDKVLTLDVAKPEKKKLVFTYTANRPTEAGGIGIGVGGPPRAQLMLREEGGFSGSLGPSVDMYEESDSFCNATADCTSSLAKGSWTPDAPPAACKADPKKCAASCNVAATRCELAAPK